MERGDTATAESEGPLIVPILLVQNADLPDRFLAQTAYNVTAQPMANYLTV